MVKLFFDYLKKCCDPKLQKKFRKDMFVDLRNTIVHEKWNYDNRQRFTFKDEDGNTITWDYYKLGQELSSLANMMIYFGRSVLAKLQK